MLNTRHGYSSAVRACQSRTTGGPGALLRSRVHHAWPQALLQSGRLPMRTKMPIKARAADNEGPRSSQGGRLSSWPRASVCVQNHADITSFDRPCVKGACVGSRRHTGRTLLERGPIMARKINIELDRVVANIVTVADIAARCGVSEDTVLQWRSRGWPRGYGVPPPPLPAPAAPPPPRLRPPP